MAANGYFQVVAEDGRMWLKIFAPEEGEVDISPEMVMKYLEASTSSILQRCSCAATRH